jgi:hypothetical protein
VIARHPRILPVFALIGACWPVWPHPEVERRRPPRFDSKQRGTPTDANGVGKRKRTAKERARKAKAKRHKKVFGK